MSTWVWRECKIYYRANVTERAFVFRLCYFINVGFTRATDDFPSRFTIPYGYPQKSCPELHFRETQNKMLIALSFIVNLCKAVKSER